MKRAISEIPILILAGGLGTRLRSVVADRPKALAPIGDKPFLQIQMEMLRDQGGKHFVLCVGYRSKQVLETFGDGSKLGIHIDYSEEREALLGTAGAIRLALKFVSNRAMVLNGDTYLDFDHNVLAATHLQAIPQGARATCTLVQRDDASRFGTAIVDERNQYLTGFRAQSPESVGPAWLNAGAYLLERTLIEDISPGEPVSLEKEVLPKVIASGGKIACIFSHRAFYDIGTPADYQRFCELHTKWQGDRNRVLGFAEEFHGNETPGQEVLAGTPSAECHHTGRCS